MLSLELRVSTAVLPVALLAIGCVGSRPQVASDAADETSDRSEEAARPTSRGAFVSGNYPNLFRDLLGKTDAEISTKIEVAYQLYFHGDLEDERLYFEADADESYIWAGPDRVITEGQSYGMMIAVQLDHKTEFDRLWRFAKTRMQHRSGPRRGYFCWKADASGACQDPNPATDGEQYFAMSLFFAAHRWGNGQGMFDYAAEAQALLETMRTGGGTAGITPMFDRRTHLPVFSPIGGAATFTLPAYNIPGFFELWSLWAHEGAAFWSEAATASRAFHRASFHPVTGLSPHKAEFDGTPHAEGADFDDDSSRAIMNVATDWVWFRKHPEAVELANRMLSFFHSQGVHDFRQVYSLDGTPKVAWQATSTISMAATGALASNLELRRAFVQRLWDQPPSTGEHRYFNGLLYILASLHLSGRFQIYAP